MSFSTVEIQGKRATPDRVYYNGTVINNTLTSVKLADDPNVVFQDQRQTAIVQDAANYEVAVQNFSLNGCSKTLPLFIPQISPILLTGVQVTQAALVGYTNQTIVYTYNPSSGQELIPGNYVQSVDGFPTYFFNFSTPTKVIAVTATTFTITVVTPTNSPPNIETSLSANCSYYDPSDITTTIYSVTLSISIGGSNNATDTQYIKWVPENKASYTIIPATANPVQIETDYYYCYTYTHWIELVNTALRTAWTNLRGQGQAQFGTLCPWFEYDQVTSLFSVNQDSKTCMVPYGTALPVPYSVTASTGANYTTGEYSFVGMNSCLENLLTNFSSTYFAAGQKWGSSSAFLPESVINMGLPLSLLVTGGSSDDTAVGVSLRTQPRTSIFQLVDPFTGSAIADAFFARLPQDYNSTGSIWSPIASFVLATSTIPVRNEASANPITFGTKNIGSISAGGAFQKVLIETPIDAVTADIWKGFVYYNPQVTSFASLDPSHESISDIDISLFWRNRLTNSLIPVHIPNQGSMSFRLLFKRKHVA